MWVAIRRGEPALLSGALLESVATPTAPERDRPMLEGSAPPEALEVALRQRAPWLPVTRTGLAGWRAERLIGISVSRAIYSLGRVGRRLALPTWFRLADVTLAATAHFEDEENGWAALEALGWSGPHSLFATLDGRLVVTAGPMGLPMPPRDGAFSDTGEQVQRDWRSGMSTADGPIVGAELVRRSLRWMLSPWALVGEPGGRAREGPLVHPELTRALTDALMATTPLALLREELAALGQQVAASEPDAARAVLSADADAVTAEVQALSGSQATLPAQLRDGGLEVALDAFLEARAATAAFPSPLVASFRGDAPTQLEVRVLANNTCLHEARMPLDVELLRVPLDRALPLAQGARVTVTVGHSRTRAPVRLEGTVLASEVELDPPTPLQRVALDELRRSARAPVTAAPIASKPAQVEPPAPQLPVDELVRRGRAARARNEEDARWQWDPSIQDWRYEHEPQPIKNFLLVVTAPLWLPVALVFIVVGYLLNRRDD